MKRLNFPRLSRRPLSRSGAAWLVAWALCSFLVASPAIGDAFPPSPRGIYILSGPSVASVKNADKDFVDGFAWRLKWKDLDSGVWAPRYDFSAVDTVVTDLQRMNKKLTIALFVQEVPFYVLASAKDRFYTVVPGEGDTTYQALAPVPWDTAAIGHYRRLMLALAEHPVYDAQRGKPVAFRDHPTLAGLRINMIGMHGLPGQNRDVVKHPSYTREKFLQGILDNLHAVLDAFPEIPAWLEYQSMRDQTKKPSLDSEVLAALAAEFDGVQVPKIGLFVEYLRGDAPKPETSAGKNLLTWRDNDGPVMFQACGPWCTHGLCNFTPGDDSPENGFRLGYGTYGALYYEVYKADLEFEDFQPVFQKWHRFLHSIP